MFPPLRPASWVCERMRAHCRQWGVYQEKRPKRGCVPSPSHRNPVCWGEAGHLGQGVSGPGSHGPLPYGGCSASLRSAITLPFALQFLRCRFSFPGGCLRTHRSISLLFCVSRAVIALFSLNASAPKITIGACLPQDCRFPGHAAMNAVRGCSMDMPINASAPQWLEVRTTS